MQEQYPTCFGSLIAIVQDMKVHVSVARRLLTSHRYWRNGPQDQVRLAVHLRLLALENLTLIVYQFDLAFLQVGLPGCNPYLYRDEKKRGERYQQGNLGQKVGARVKARVDIPDAGQC